MGHCCLALASVGAHRLNFSLKYPPYNVILMLGYIKHTPQLDSWPRMTLIQFSVNQKIISAFEIVRE